MKVQPKNLTIYSNNSKITTFKRVLSPSNMPAIPIEFHYSDNLYRLHNTVLTERRLRLFLGGMGYEIPQGTLNPHYVYGTLIKIGEKKFYADLEVFCSIKENSAEEELLINLLERPLFPRL